MKKPLVISILLAIAPLSFAATHNLDGRTLTVDGRFPLPEKKLLSRPKAGQELKPLTKLRLMPQQTAAIFTV